MAKRRASKGHSRRILRCGADRMREFPTQWASARPRRCAGGVRHGGRLARFGAHVRGGRVPKVQHEHVKGLFNEVERFNKRVLSESCQSREWVSGKRLYLVSG